MSVQDDQDYLDLLAGKAVPHAAPNTIREAEIFRAALQAYADKKKTAKVEEPYPPILAKVLQRLETEGYLPKPKVPEISKSRAIFPRYDPLFSLAASLLIAVLIIAAPIPRYNAKSLEPCVNEFVELQPQLRIANLRQELTTLGIATQIIQLKNGWRLQATLPTDKSPALLQLLARHDNLIVLPESQYLCVNILAEEAQ
ncbi:MAG: hypothetical protein HC877_00415 [Thioploca sp.]|nr:hypothetical protein [Thioploca sp.]